MGVFPINLEKVHRRRRKRRRSSESLLHPVMAWDREVTANDR